MATATRPAPRAEAVFAPRGTRTGTTQAAPRGPRLAGLVALTLAAGLAPGQGTAETPSPPDLEDAMIGSVFGPRTDAGAEPIRAMHDPVRGMTARLLRSGAVLSQGDLPQSQFPGATNAGLARETFGVDGSGVVIGIISDSFDALGGAEAGVAAGELPGFANPAGFGTPVLVLRDDFAGTSIDEGRGMAEIVHDLAPGATILFHSAFNNDPFNLDNSIAVAIDNLVAAGCDIVVDDVGSLAASFYQDGFASRSVANAVDAGAVYFSAAGNSGTEAWEGPFRGAGETGNVHSFKPLELGSDTFLDIDVDPGATLRVSVQWSDPFPSNGPTGGREIADFDAGLFDEDGNVLDIGVNDQTAGLDPFEIVGFTNTAPAAARVRLLVQRFAGPEDRTIKAILFGAARVAPDEDDDTNSPTVFSHPGAADAIACGAALYLFDSVEPFSSRGPITILFDEQGRPIEDVRPKPDLTSTNGADTSFFPPVAVFGNTDFDNTGNPNFSGTSAAAPHAAAIAALVIDRYRRETGGEPTVAQVRETLLKASVPIAPPEVAGAGLLDALAAVGGIEAAAEGSACPADLNGDGNADTVDVLLLLAVFGSACAADTGPCNEADIDADGDNDILDVLRFLTAFDTAECSGATPLPGV